MPLMRNWQRALDVAAQLDARAEARRRHKLAIDALAAAATPACAHTEITVLRSCGSSFDDHETTYGQCRACGEWVVSTLHFNGGDHIETRTMTDAERTQLQREEDQRARDEWLSEGC